MTTTAPRPPASGPRPQPSRGAVYRQILTATNAPEGARLDPLAKALVVSRAAVLPMTLFAGLVAGLLAVRRPGFSFGWWLLATVGIVLAHVANNLMNDLFDLDAGSDTADYPRNLYSPHPILSGLVTRSGFIAATLAVNLVDLVILVVLTAARGWPVVAFALAGFALSFAYTAPPMRLKKRGLGEPDVLITWGPLMVAGTYYSAVGHLPWQVWLAALPYGVLCTTVLMGKHTDKIPYDAPLGIRTLPVMLGAARGRAVTLGLMVAFHVLVVVAVAVRALPWPALLALGGITTLVKVGRAYRRPAPATKPRGFPVWPLWFAALAFLHVRRAGALLVLGLAVAAIFNVTWG